MLSDNLFEHGYKIFLPSKTEDQWGLPFHLFFVFISWFCVIHNFSEMRKKKKDINDKETPEYTDLVHANRFSMESGGLKAQILLLVWHSSRICVSYSHLSMTNSLV